MERLKTEGLSLLTAKVTVYDSNGKVVATSASVDPTNNDLQLSFRPGLFGGNYTIKVEGARGDVFDIGAYKVAVDFLSVGGLLTPLTTTLSGVLDGGTDDLLATALGLQTNTSGLASRYEARVHLQRKRDGPTEWILLHILTIAIQFGCPRMRATDVSCSGWPVASVR